MKKEEVMLCFAEINRQLNEASISFEDFLMQDKITKGRDFRRCLRTVRNSCIEAIRKSHEYEQTLRDRKARRKNER